MTNERIRILEMIENGEISAEEGAKLLTEVKPQEITTGEESLSPMRILEMIDAGDISPEEGANLLQGGKSIKEETQQEPQQESDPPAPEYAKAEVIAADEPVNTAKAESVEKWKQWWMIPLWIGVGITVLSGVWMNSLLQEESFGFWFYFSWLPLMVGIAIIAMAWASRNAPWLHVRVRQNHDGPENIAISFPLPLRFSAWILRTFGNNISGLENTNVDEIITAIDMYANSSQPIFIEVDNDEDGEHVEVFIG